MNKKNRNLNFIWDLFLAAGFMLALAWFCVQTCPKVVAQKKEEIRSVSSFESLSATISSVQDSYKENLWEKQVLTDVASYGDKVLRRCFADNYRYYCQDNVMYALSPDWDFSNVLAENMATLSKEARAQGDDAVFVFAHQPARDELATVPESLSYENGSARELAETLAVLDGSGVYDFEIPAEDTVYFRTDMHNTTESQIDIWADIVAFLEEKGVYFPDTSLLNYQNENLYEKQELLLLGGYGRSVGRGLVGTDVFTRYYPKDNTSFYVYAFDSGEEFRGTMKEVLVREAYDPENMYHYHIVDCGFYGHSAYVIVNDRVPEGPKVVVTMDSASLTGINYLAMVCNQVLVLDPRFDTGGVCEMALQSAKGVYDAYILYYISDSMGQYPILVSE